MSIQKVNGDSQTNSDVVSRGKSKLFLYYSFLRVEAFFGPYILNPLKTKKNDVSYFNNSRVQLWEILRNSMR